MEIDKIKTELADMILCDAVYYYEFDLTTGKIEQEIIGSDGTNYTSVMGISLPCDFDEMIQKSFTGKMNLRYTSESEVTKTISKETLRRSFMSGRNKEAFFVYYPAENTYYKLTYLMKADPETGHTRVFAICKAVSATYMKQEARLADTFSRFIMKDLGVNYLAVFSVDLEMNTIEIHKIKSENSAMAVLDKFSHELNYDEAINKYINHFVVPEERETVREKFSRNTIKKDLETRNSRIMRCNCMIGDGPVFCVESHMIRANGSTNQILVVIKNVEEQVQLEKDRCRQEHKRQQEINDYSKTLSDYNSIVSNAGLGIWYIFLKDGEKPRLKPSKKMREILGIEDREMSEEEIYEYWDNGIMEEARPSVQASVQEMMSGKFSENTYKWKHPVKGITYARCGGTADILPDGTAVLSGYHSDVTDIVLEDEKKKAALSDALMAAEKARKEREDDLCVISGLNNKYHTIWLLDPESFSLRLYRSTGNGTIQAVVDNSLKKIYYEPVVKDYINEFIPSEAREETWKKLNPAVVKENISKKGTYDVTYPRIFNGITAFHRMTFGKTAFSDGRETYILGLYDVNDDVTKELQQMKSLEDALTDAKNAKTDQKLQHDIVTSLSRDFLNVYLVNAAEKKVRILKLDGYVTEGLERGTPKLYPYDTIVSQYIKDRVYPEDQEMMTETMNLDNVLVHLSAKPEYAGSYRVLDQDRVSYYQYKYMLTGDEGKVIAAFRNIDDIVEAEVKQKNALAEALDRAEKASKAKTDFLFNMSHDIRTPMNAIIGYTDLLKKNADNLELRNRYIENIQTSNRYLLDLINNVLDTARIESGKATLDEVLSDSFEIGRVLDTAFANEIAKKHIRYTFHNSVVHRYVYHDVTKMEQIMFNIVSNAVKYTPDGGSIDIFFSEEPADREGYANFTSTIKDTGIGISKEFLPHIFDTFSRERTVTDNKIVGTGLGMGIVKKLVDLMGGTITVESELGKGTTVSFTIPHRIADAPVKTENDVSSFTPESFYGKRILLAEDNSLNAEIAMEILNEVGFEVEHAEDGIICVDMLNKHDAGYYDLILMDIQMPNMNGIKATSVIRSIPDKSKSQIPILAMTANAFEEDKQNALAAGMNGHIAKPIEIKKLMEALAKILK